jgi:hypothetical protein
MKHNNSVTKKLKITLQYTFNSNKHIGLEIYNHTAVQA